MLLAQACRKRLLFEGPFFMGERKVQVGFMRHFPELRGQFGIIGQAENKKNTFKWLMLKVNCETIRKDW